MKKIAFVVLLIIFQSIALFSQVLTNLDFDVNYKQLVNELKSKNYVQVSENENIVLLKGVTLNKNVDLVITFSKRTYTVLSLYILFEKLVDKKERKIFYNYLNEIFLKTYGQPKSFDKMFDILFGSTSWKIDDVMITIGQIKQSNQVYISYTQMNRLI